MKVGEEEYYCIASLESIKKESVRSFIKKFDSFEEAVLFPNAVFFVIKKRLASENVPGSGLVYPNVYNYKIVNNKKQSYFIKLGNASLFDCNIKSYGFGFFYSYDGKGEVSVLDRYSQVQIVSLSSNSDFEVGIIENLLIFLLDFELLYNADWKNYDITSALNQKISEQEKIIEETQLQVADLKKKMSALRKELREHKKSR